MRFGADAIQISGYAMVELEYMVWRGKIEILMLVSLLQVWKLSLLCYGIGAIYWQQQMRNYLSFKPIY